MSIVEKLLRKESPYVIPRISLRGETAEKFQKFVRITKLHPDQVAAAIIDEVLATDAGINAVLGKAARPAPAKGRPVKKAAARKPAPVKAKAKKAKPVLGPVQKLAIQIASIKKVVTGKVYTEFNEKHADKIKGLKPDEVRALRLKWLQGELARLKKK